MVLLLTHKFAFVLETRIIRVGATLFLIVLIFAFGYFLQQCSNSESYYCSKLNDLSRHSWQRTDTDCLNDIDFIFSSSHGCMVLVLYPGTSTVLVLVLYFREVFKKKIVVSYRTVLKLETLFISHSFQVQSKLARLFQINMSIDIRTYYGTGTVTNLHVWIVFYK